MSLATTEQKWYVDHTWDGDRPFRLLRRVADFPFLAKPLLGRNGREVRFKTFESAQTRADKLNKFFPPQKPIEKTP